MKKIACCVCEKNGPLGESFSYHGKDYCAYCLKSLKEGQGIDDADVGRNVDPTVCATCSKDSGDTELSKTSGFPLCPTCEKALLHRPFPVWIKAFFGITAALVALGFFVNRGFFVSYYNMREGLSAVKAADIAKAASRLRKAAQAAPGQREIKYIADFYSGIEALMDDRSADALSLLQACKGVYPDETQLNELILNAEIGAAFDARDYLLMYRKSADFLNASPQDGVRMLALASSAACVYAESGDQAYRKEAEDLMSRADALTTPENRAEYEEYSDRIRYRLESRRIITREEYQKLFPATEKEGAQ